MLWGEDGGTGAGVSSSSPHRLYRQAQDKLRESWLGKADMETGPNVQSDRTALHGMLHQETCRRPSMSKILSPLLVAENANFSEPRIRAETETLNKESSSYCFVQQSPLGNTSCT